MTVIEGAPSVSSEPASQELPPAGCVVCRFVGSSLERRIFFLFAEGLGEGWFVDAMRRGGFCLRHARHVGREGGARLAGACRHVLAGWRGRLGREEGERERERPASPACPLCETESWAEGHALWLLAGPDRDRAATALGAVEPLCLAHLERLLGLAGFRRVPEVRARLVELLERATTTGPGLEERLTMLIGPDPDQPIRTSGLGGLAAPPDGPSTSWSDGLLSVDGFMAELAVGRCPACTGPAALVRRLLGWLAGPDLRPEDRREQEHLCPGHLRDALAVAPLAAERALAATLAGWLALVEGLPTAAELPAPAFRERVGRLGGRYREERARRPQRPGPLAAAGAALADLLSPAASVERRVARARAQRTHPCVACAVMAGAAGRTLDLADALLVAGPAAERYRASGGLCLGHAARAAVVLGPEARSTVLSTARARVARQLWELDEAVRKSSWSVRYEPRGPETRAWIDALVLVLGDQVRSADLLTPEPRGPVAAA